MKKIISTVVAIAMIMATLGVSASTETQVQLVSAPIEISADTTYSNITFERADGYTGTIFKVTGGMLTLENCVIDAGAEWSLKDGIKDTWIETIENGGKASLDINDTIEAGASVISTENLISLENGGDLTLKGTTIENSYALTAVSLIALSGAENNEVVIENSVIRNIASQKKYAVLTTESKGEDTVVFKGDTKVYGNVATDPGALMCVCNGSTMTFENGVEFYENIGLDANGVILMCRYGTLNINGGKIYNNYGFYTGHNNNLSPLYIHDNSSFTMNGGEISNNYGYRGTSIITRSPNTSAELTGGEIGEGQESNNVWASTVLQTPVTIGEEMTVKDGVYAMAEIENNGTIVGDVTSFSDVANNGTIEGNVMTMGVVTNEGSINGDVVLYGTESKLENGETGTVSGKVELEGIQAQNLTTGKKYEDFKEAINEAIEGDTVKLAAGTFEGGIAVGKNITLEGTLDENGNIATVFSGENDSPKSYYCYSIYMNAGTIKNIKITNAWKGIMTEGSGNLTIDNVKMEEIMYGIHIAEAKAANETVHIKNSEIDVRWGNSFAGGDYKIVAEDNVFTSVNPYMADGALSLNLYNGNCVVKNNIFRENAKILYNDTDLTGKVEYGPNYFEDGAQNAFFRANGNYSDDVFPVYIDEAKTEISNVELITEASIGNITVECSDILRLVTEADYSSNVKFEIAAEYVNPESKLTIADGEKVEYLDICVLRNGEEFALNGTELMVKVDLGNKINGTAKVYHFNGASWDEITGATTNESAVRFETNSMSPFAIVYGETAVTDIASAIELKLEKKADDLYEVVLYGANDKVINRFMSGELTFDLVSDTLAYEIVKNGFVNVINPIGDSEKYGFNLNGTNAPDITGKKITVATVKLNGYGEGKLSVVDGVVRTAEIADNIVDTFIDDDATLILNEGIAKNVEVSVPVPQQKLTIEIDFPNAVEDNENAYQQMWVTVSGGDLASEIPFNLGTDGEKLDGIYSMSCELTKNTGYNIEVKGAGYRTARYYVVMTEDKTVKFWNNVKDNDTEMEFYTDEFGTSFKKGSTKINFLAGDIVKDNIINIYDLSAVVSYFGEEDLQNTNTGYAKYDLNRDGKIDSKDVAYVLVSWGK